jgi:ATP-dependent RNA helicase RhlE
MQFQELKLIEPLLRAIHAEGYDKPTPIQVQAIPHVLTGTDLIGCAQTGTGKTAAFALPILQRMVESTQGQRRGVLRALILSPTRELASQIDESFEAYGKHTGLRHAVIYGGVGKQPQINALKRGIDILVATPGRLLDLMGEGYIQLNKIEVFVLDEADRMLDMGFIHDVRRVVRALPQKRQTLLFSATMPPAIQELARQMLYKPVRVEVTPQATTVESIQQSVFFVDKKQKGNLLKHLLDNEAIRRVLVFTRTKHGANKLAKQLNLTDITAEAIHGNKSQTARERALESFKSGKVRVLVATDIAARGIDVDDVTHVINYDLPNEPESYVHRIGRTARAGASGIAYSFCDAEERKYLRDIERIIRLSIPVVKDHPFPPTEGASAPTDDVENVRRGRGPRPSTRRKLATTAEGTATPSGNSQSRNRNRNRRRNPSRSSE